MSQIIPRDPETGELLFILKKVGTTEIEPLNEVVYNQNSMEVLEENFSNLTTNGQSSGANNQINRNHEASEIMEDFENMKLENAPKKH